MLRFKFTRALVFGICLAMFSSTAAFAETGATKPAEVQVQPGEEVRPDNVVPPDAERAHSTEGFEGAGVSGAVQPAEPISEEMLKKQDEINLFLFEQHKDKIAQMGFAVTHTAPFDKYVEIGITPYNEKYAEYLYGVFGSDTVKVVEGVQATLADLPTTAADGVVSNTAVEEAVPDMVKSTAPLSEDGRNTDGSAAVNEPDQIYTINSVSEQAGAPEMAAFADDNAVSYVMPATAIIAAMAILLAAAVVLARRLKAAKS